MRLRLCLCGFLFIPLAAFPQKKEIVEVGRDLATLRDEVRTLQTSLTEKMDALKALVQQSVEANSNSAKAMETRIDQLQKQQATVGQPVVVMGTKIDQMSGDLQSLRETLLDVSSRLGKLDQKVVDLNNAFRAIQAPPAAPSTSMAPAIPAATLFETALRDQLSGKTDLALKQFNDYLQLYGDTDKAPDAQYQIGQIHWEQNDLENAVKDFDAVIERYPSSSKTGEAMFMKGQALVKLGRKTDGQKEFKALLTNYPRHELASKACTQLKALGYNCTVPAASKKRD